MFEMKLHLNPDVTLGHVRQFVKACERFDNDYPVASYGEHGELDGLAVVVDNIG